jgi:NAD(P)-dependent dehydrogenase (short-subunit alcohol dehydrogenase family)
MMDVSGKKVLMTGATGGLGEMVVRRFNDSGAQVAIADRKSEPAPGTLDGLRDPLFVGDADVTSEESVQRMVARVIDAWGRIDVLVNIAGGWRGGTPVHATPVETWDFVMNLNAKSVFLVSRAVLPHMLTQQSGKIVSVAAKSGLEGRAGTAVYNASKSAVIRLTEAMSAEVKDHGINVNCVLPTIIDTPINRQQMPGSDFEKWVTPDAMADVLLFLASDAARAIHGAAIPVYGRV